MAPSLLIVLCAVSATISLVSLARVLASRPGRPTGVWLDWAPGNRSYYVTSSRHSHLGCLTACADLSQEEGVPVAPACVDSAEASTFVADRTAGLTIFLGHHQWPNDRGASVGWRPATLDCNASYENWLPSEPDDLLEMQDCVAASDAGGGWSDVGCERRLPCLCQKGAVLSESFAASYACHPYCIVSLPHSRTRLQSKAKFRARPSHQRRHTKPMSMPVCACASPLCSRAPRPFARTAHRRHGRANVA